MSMLCYEECKQKFILCRAYIEGHQLLDSCMDLHYCYINLISRLQLDYIIMHMHLFTMYYYHKCFNC